MLVRAVIAWLYIPVIIRKHPIPAASSIALRPIATQNALIVACPDRSASVDIESQDTIPYPCDVKALGVSKARQYHSFSNLDRKGGMVLGDTMPLLSPALNLKEENQRGLPKSMRKLLGVPQL